MSKSKLYNLIDRLIDSRSSNITGEDFLEGNYRGWQDLKYRCADPERFELNEIGDFNELDDSDYIVKELDSDYKKKVYYFSKYSTYLLFKGYQNSYSDVQFESFEEVQPITKTIITFEKV